MQTTRTSENDPLRIAPVNPGDGRGRIGITLCPGKTDPSAMLGPVARDLDADLDVIRGWGTTAVVCLITKEEMEYLESVISEEGVRDRHMEWVARADTGRNAARVRVRRRVENRRRGGPGPVAPGVRRARPLQGGPGPGRDRRRSPAGGAGGPPRRRDPPRAHGPRPRHHREPVPGGPTWSAVPRSGRRSRHGPRTASGTGRWGRSWVWPSATQWARRWSSAPATPSRAWKTWRAAARSTNRPAVWTDDTSMALALADSLAASGDARLPGLDGPLRPVVAARRVLAHRRVLRHRKTPSSAHSNGTCGPAILLPARQIRGPRATAR